MHHSIKVSRTARYITLGPENSSVSEVWFVLHGYGQLAATFVNSFATLDDGKRLIVAPEALNRFYLTGVDTPAADRPVGATWMTREERESEIEDYVSYLDRVAGDVLSRLPGGRWPARVIVFGFSQGTATAARWVSAGSIRPTQLVLWGGFVPPELVSATQGGRLGTLSPYIVIGSRDKFVTADRLADEERRMHDAGIPYRVLRYEGAHSVQSPALTTLVRTIESKPND